MLREYYTTKPRARGVELWDSMEEGRIGSNIILVKLAMRGEGSVFSSALSPGALVTVGRCVAGLL
jgi:hypothetical protein